MPKTLIGRSHGDYKEESTQEVQVTRVQNFLESLEYFTKLKEDTFTLK